MGGIFIKRVWQSYICQPNQLKRDMKKLVGGGIRGPSENLGGKTHPGPLLELPWYTAEMGKLTIQRGN